MEDINKLLNKYGVICTQKNTKPFCEYFIGGGNKYCRATTQKSCYDCRFYSPVSGEKIHLLSALLEKETESLNKCREENTMLIFANKEKAMKIRVLSVRRLFDEM